MGFLKAWNLHFDCVVHHKQDFDGDSTLCNHILSFMYLQLPSLCQNHDMLYTELLFSGKLNVLSQTPGGTGNDLGSLATFMGNQASEAEG